MSKQREGLLVNKIRKALESRGWIVYKNHGSRYSGAGRVDLDCYYGKRVMLLEVKLPGERPTPLQAALHAKLFETGIPVYVVHDVSDAVYFADAVMHGD